MGAKTKKDFAGKTKTKNTYDKDWVFVKNRHTTGPNASAGAWMTRRQARKAHQDKWEALQARALRANQHPAAAGGTTTPTAPVDTTGTVTVPTEAAPTPAPVAGSTLPAWWIGQAISNPDENQAFANAANALMPYLSPEDARTMGNYLATNYKDVYGGYSNANFGPIPTRLTNERNTYLNPQRAQGAIGLLDKMQKAAGGDAAKFGQGYDFLRNAVNLMTKYNTAGQPMTREQYAQFQAGLQALNAQAGKNISAYSNLSQMFNLPSFSAGELVQNNPNAKLTV